MSSRLQDSQPNRDKLAILSMIGRLLTDKTTKQVLFSLLVLTGMTLMTIRWFSFETSRVLEEDTAWKVTINGRFDAIKDKSIIYTTRPKSGRYTRVISQRLYHPAMRLKSAKPSSKSTLIARATRTGSIEFLSEYHIQLSSAPALLATKPVLLDVHERESYLQSDDHIDLSNKSLQNLSSFLNKDVNNRQELLHKIFTHSHKMVATTAPANHQLGAIISTNKATTLGRARLMIALCRLNNIPARIVSGIILQPATSSQPYYWVQVYDDESRWINYDPEKGYEHDLPHNYVVFSYNDPHIFTTENGKVVKTTISVEEDSEILNVALLEQEKDILDIFDLRRLDLDTRDALIKILLLPFCVLLTALFRHVLGFFPYGTFTPALLALAMTYAEPLVTIIIAAIVIFLALVGRSMLPKSYPRAPRLSLIFTFVALSMVLSVSILSYLDINAGGNIILLPTIILVAIVDRFYSYMDTSSTHAATLRLGVTILTAAFCVPILTFEELGIFILTYPEAHLLTAAFVLLFSSYKGKKLTDNKYLKLLGENKTQKPRKRKKKPAEPVATTDENQSDKQV